MSSKQVPEIKQLPISEQMKRLEEWVRGHMELFNRYRGCLHTNHLDEPDFAVSPTADLRQFDQYVGDVRVFRNAVAVLHRDGCNAAVEALQRALHSTDRWERPVKLPFEDDLPTEKQPMVLLMFEPSKMFQIMRWFPNNFMELDALFREGGSNVPSEETKCIARILPSIRKHWERRRRGGFVYQREVFDAIAEDLLGPFGGIQEWFNVCSSDALVATLYLGGTHEGNVGYAHTAYEGVAFAYLLRGTHQRDVLARIPRQLQENVATWQFEVYEKTWFGIPHHKVMLIPEVELGSWEGIHKSSLSKGTTAGYVAVYNPTEVFNSLPDGKPRDMKSTLVLDSR